MHATDGELTIRRGLVVARHDFTTVFLKMHTLHQNVPKCQLRLCWRRDERTRTRPAHALTEARSLDLVLTERSDAGVVFVDRFVTFRAISCRRHTRRRSQSLHRHARGHAHIHNMCVESSASNRWRVDHQSWACCRSSRLHYCFSKNPHVTPNCARMPTQNVLASG